MKLPLSWMRDFVSVDAPVEEISRRLSYAGLVVENIEKLKPGFAGVFAARVVNVEKHPNADRLNLVDVDAGEKEKFKVVCGAPNVRAGMVAPLALVGAQLGKEPPLEAAVIRGVQSEGMLCSERELGLSQDHAGILALGADARRARRRGIRGRCLDRRARSLPALRRARDDWNQDRSFAGVAQTPAGTVRDARAQQRRRRDQLRDARARATVARVRLR